MIRPRQYSQFHCDSARRNPLPTGPHSLAVTEWSRGQPERRPCPGRPAAGHWHAIHRHDAVAPPARGQPPPPRGPLPPPHGRVTTRRVTVTVLQCRRRVSAGFRLGPRARTGPSSDSGSGLGLGLGILPWRHTTSESGILTT
jgi:hypothetical protein